MLGKDHSLNRNTKAGVWCSGPLATVLQMGLLVDLRGVIQTLTQNDHLTFQPTYLNISTLHIFMVVCNLWCVYDKHISVHESG